MLETALAYGADAIHAGQPRYSPRVRVSLPAGCEGAFIARFVN